MIISERYKVWGGPRPSSLQDLAGQGIKRIINLQSGVYDVIRVYSETYYEETMQFPNELGMVEYHLPCSDITAPRAIYVKKVLSLVADGTPTYIHCLSGRDRTGFMAAAIKMRYVGLSYEQAVSWWRGVRHPWYFYWEHALREFST